MPLPSASFVLAVCLLLYLATFVFFALLRIITGVSIQRVGYSGLRRIAFSPRDGVTIRIRGLGLSLHRPTFAQPTWVSLDVTEFHLFLDPSTIRASKDHAAAGNGKAKSEKRTSEEKADDTAQEDTWKKLTRWKERLKLLHRKINWLSMIDLAIVRSSVTIKGIGTLRVERIALGVDTRSKTVDRSRLFQHHKAESDDKRPAEWRSLFRSVLFTPEGKDSTEILDYCTWSVHGFLHKELDGLRDASIGLKMGRLTIPYDDVDTVLERLHTSEPEPMADASGSSKPGAIPSISVTETDADFGQSMSLKRSETIVQAVSDAREFVSSVLRGIREIQFAVGFFGVSKRIQMVRTSGQHVYFNLAVKEVGLDVVRLEPRSPSHRMYFSPKDVAHQALLTAIAISAGIDDGHEHPERMLYIPMMTATIKTTMPSKAIQYREDADVRERNTNILFANLVCTSPSVDLDPKHLPLLLAVIENNHAASASRPGMSMSSRHDVIARLLPKATIKLAVQEPVIRVSLPPHRSATKDGEESQVADDDYDMIIFSTSSMALDVESQHAAERDEQYGLSLTYRQTSHHLYWQKADGSRHDIVFADTVEVKVDVTAIPQPSVTVAARLSTFSMYLVRSDICEGIRLIVQTLRGERSPRERSNDAKKPSFLRRVPTLLQHVTVEASDFSVDVAGIDRMVSEDARGVGLQLDSWSVEYKTEGSSSHEAVERKRSSSRARAKAERKAEATDKTPKRVPTHADGRRLAVHVHGLEGSVIDPSEKSQPDVWMSLPKFEVAFSSHTDQHGPIFHVNSFIKKFYLNYSIYNYFSIGVAVLSLRKTFLSPDSAEKHENKAPPINKNVQRPGLAPQPSEQSIRRSTEELMTFDIKAGLIQVKAVMPADPPMMLQIYGLEGGKHRWATPFFRSRLARLYASTPGMRSVWSRIVSLKTIKVDIRPLKRKRGNQWEEERSIDIVTEGTRIGVPHGLIVHSIFDNIVNVAKVTEQLLHHFVTGNADYILAKHPEGPKRVPKLSFRSQVFLFETEDSTFENKLGNIYRAGLVEQRQRLAREDAFRMKEKRMNAPPPKPKRATSSNAVNRPSQRNASPSGNGENSRRRSASLHSPPSSDGQQSQHRGRLRYDAEGAVQMGRSGHRSIQQAREALDRFNAQSWKRRIDRTLRLQHTASRDIRSFVWGLDSDPDEVDDTEPIMALSQRPGLMVALISDLNISVDRPSFPSQDLPQFLHDLGKGMPLDMQYGLLVPMNLAVSMGEIRMNLRDYPLPLLHVPPIKYGQSPRLPSLSLSTDFVIAEEFRDTESQRSVSVAVVPPEKMSGHGSSKGFSISVRRTISPVKTYSNMRFEINTSSPTRITWGTSYQPAIQDLMQVIEGFTKPPVDPSDRVGFWDKIRLSFHSRISVNWKGDGDVHLNLKGSRDPYVVVGHGGGFVMVWRKNVCWRIAQDDDPKRFMTVDSGEYILAVPDFNRYARELVEDDSTLDIVHNNLENSKSSAIFKKVIMKLSGNVQWLAGLCFEKGIVDGSRSFDFKPHYDVVLKHPDYATAPAGQEYDAYHGFRSQHIHMSIAVVAPRSRDWSVQNLSPSSNYNSVHLSPRFFTHFLSWWSMFSGVMSIPIRQGPLWGSQEKSSKKFGRHLATIKYNLLLSPVFIAHIYKHKETEDYQAHVTSATGLKLKLNSLMLDLHQRRETFEIPGHEDTKCKTTTGMKINQCQLDFISGDIRAVSATIHGTTAAEIDRLGDGGISSMQSATSSKIDMSKFNIPDNDTTWIDMDDYVELGWILPQESNPETKILPLASAPRFSYFRQTDHGDSISGDKNRYSPFGDEPTHECIMSSKNDPRRVQADLIRGRMSRISEQLVENERASDDQELKCVRDVQSGSTNKDRLQAFKSHSEALRRKYHFLDRMLKTLMQRLEDNDPAAVPEFESPDQSATETHDEYSPPHSNILKDSIPLGDYTSDFNNRFVVHNPQIKWNNSLRNIILRYVHQVSQRRGFIYYMSRRSVRFILDILEEQKKKQPHTHTPQKFERSYSADSEPQSPDGDDEDSIQDRIDQLLNDGKQFVKADDPEKANPRSNNPSHHPQRDEISPEFTSQNAYHFRLIAPQIQLQSERNTKSAMLVAAKGMQLKVIQIMDKDRVSDEVSGLVQRRISATMDSLQVFVTSTKTFSTDLLHMYSGNRYGTKAGSYWPPWVPVESMYEFSHHPYGFSRVVKRTSASMRLDKFNTLRIKYNDNLSGNPNDETQPSDSPENRMDHLFVDFPQFRAICDSSQYYAMYIIVVDLLLYNEPLEKTRSERLEKIMLASDFSDLTGAPEMVETLQARIRQIEEIKMHFQVNEKLLDRQGWKDRIAMEKDLTSCEDELFFMLKAITTSQQRVEDRSLQEASTGVLRWLVSAKEIVWHLIRENGESLLEMQLKDGLFDRTDNSDGSNANTVELGRINGYNLLPNALYPQIIAPYVDEARGVGGSPDQKMLRVQWLMLEAIAGIPVVDYFEVDLVPVRVQFEREIAKRLFEYIFPGVGGSAFEGSGFSPFMVKKMLPTQEEEDDDDGEKDADATGLASSTDGTPDPERANGTGSGKGPGTLESRLQPTLKLTDSQPPKPKKHGLGINYGAHLGHGHRHWSPFQHNNKSSQSVSGNRVTSRSSLAQVMSRTPSQASMVTTDVGTPSADSEKTSRHSGTLVRRSASVERGSKADSKAEKDNKQSDDLTQMMSRASNYMTLGFFKVQSMVLCLSYKGRGQRNIEDVHDLVFRMPTIEYRNKTWSNLDLALQMKKDLIKALIGHAGAIVGNKFHARPNKQQQSRFRELANNSTLISTKTFRRAALDDVELSSHGPISRVDGEDNDSDPGSSVTSLPHSEMQKSFSMNSSKSEAAAAPDGSTHTTDDDDGDGDDNESDGLLMDNNKLSLDEARFHELEQVLDQEEAVVRDSIHPSNVSLNRVNGNDSRPSTQIPTTSNANTNANTNGNGNNSGNGSQEQKTRARTTSLGHRFSGIGHRLMGTSNNTSSTNTNSPLGNSSMTLQASRNNSTASPARNQSVSRASGTSPGQARALSKGSEKSPNRRAENSNAELNDGNRSGPGPPRTTTGSEAGTKAGTGIRAGSVQGSSIDKTKRDGSVGKGELGSEAMRSSRGGSVTDDGRDGSAAPEDNEENTKFKSKLLLGGQKLLRSLPRGDRFTN